MQIFNLFLDLFNSQVCNLLILFHEVLNSLVNLFSCLDDHVVDVHVCSHAVCFVEIVLTSL